MIKILHTGDVHLDAPFSGLSPDEASLRRRDSRAVFTSMMTYARTENVDLILIAGDLFDSAFVTRDTLSFISAEFEKVRVPVFISPGNHDPYTDDSVWARVAFPENVRVFDSCVLQHHSLDNLGVDVYGYAFTSKSLRQSPVTGTVADPSKINLLCIHADMASMSSAYAPLSRPMLESFGADYAALGHIHNPTGYMGDAGKCVYAYCGCPEGRSFDECGEKSALVVEIDKLGDEPKVTIRPKKFSQRRYEIVTVDVHGASSMSDIIRMTESVLGDGDPYLSARVRLTGSVDPSLVISKSALISAFPNIFSMEIADETLPLWDSDSMENDMTVRGEFYRMIKPKLESADEHERNVAIRALRYVCAAMQGENISEI